jgi:hypothetical protein
MAEEDDDHVPTEEDQAKITPLFQAADKYGNILWYNEDSYLRTEEMNHEQVLLFYLFSQHMPLRPLFSWHPFIISR